MKKNAIPEVAGVFALIFIALNAFRLTPVAEWQRELLTYPFIEYTVLIAVPLGVIYFKRGDFGAFGITYHNTRYHIDIALVCLSVIIPISALKYGFLSPVLGISYFHWSGALIWSALIILSLLLIAALVKNKPTCSLLPASPLSGFFILLVLTCITAAAATPYTDRISAFLFYLFFVGFGEEILFRGYIQSRLNTSFGRPFQFMGIHWGWGLIIASVLFGFMHYINPFNPFQFWWAFWTFFSGLLYGIIREKTGSIIAPGIIHGTPRAFAALFFG